MAQSVADEAWLPGADFAESPAKAVVVLALVLAVEEAMALAGKSVAMT